MSILEGMAAGLPCVFTKGCNFPEAEEAQVAIIVNSEVGEISSALLHCLKNLSEVQKMGARGRQFIFDNYSWQGVADRMLKMYQSILISKASQA